MIAYCICMNDAIMHVVIDNEEAAISLMGLLKANYYEKNKHAFTDYKEYEIRGYWHIHEVPAF